MKAVNRSLGCWFCACDAEFEPLYIEREFDTFVHLSCLQRRLTELPNDEEANLMKYMLAGNI